ncbi:MAG TPA: TlpA disulfide reductase family protein [Chitinophagaceae bacterium]
MKKLLFLLAFIPSLLFAQQSGFRISGTVTGLQDGEEVKITSTQDNSVLAKGVAKGSAFTVEGTIPEPGLYWLVLGSEQPLHVYLENNGIKISGSKADIKNIKIEGSQSHKDFDEFRTVFNPLVGELNGTVAQVQKAENEQLKADLMKRYDSLTKLINSEVGKFVAAKRSSYVSPFLMFVTAQLYDDPLLMEQRYMSLDEKVRQSQIGKSLAEFITFNKVGAIGTEAIDFTQNDLDGKPVALSSFKGKYVLLDFWASWCKPCRIENPNVVKAYNKFKDKNFTILGVSLDQNEEAWKKAIEKDGLPWTHVSDLQSWNNAVAALYRVQAIPQNYLIDPNGKIIAKNLRAEQLEEKLCEVLGCN